MNHCKRCGYFQTKYENYCASCWSMLHEKYCVCDHASLHHGDLNKKCYRYDGVDCNCLQFNEGIPPIDILQHRELL